MRQFACYGALLLGVACSATDKLDPTPPPAATSVRVKVSGTVLAAPPFAPGLDLTTVQATVVIHNPLELLNNASTPPLGTTVLNTGLCTAQGCPFEVADVPLSNLDLGLVAGVLSADANAPALVPTFTGIATAEQATQAVVGSSDITGVSVFAGTPVATQLFGALTGLGAETFLQRGAFIGLMVESLSAPVPLTGVTIEARDDTVALTFPNATFDGVVSPPATASSGIFVMTPNAPRVVSTQLLTSRTVDAATTRSATPQAGSLPGHLLIVAITDG